MRISKLTKGQVRKLNSFRKFLGNKITDLAFSKWLKTQTSNKSGGNLDPVATQLERSLKSLASKKINLENWGYTIKRAKGQVWKLDALRKSLGNKITVPAFSEWLKTQTSNKFRGNPDPVATQLERSLKSIASKKINLGNWGYTIKRAKGQVRKLNALRKSLGNKIADQTFSKWLKTQTSNKSGGNPDPVATQLERSLKSLASKKINLGNWGYTIKRAKGKGAKGFVATKNKKPS
jgi:biotin operon repressor